MLNDHSSILILGPFISSSSLQWEPGANFTHTGSSLELCVDGQHFEFPIFEKNPWWQGFKLCFEDLYVLGRAGEWPVDFSYNGSQEDTYPTGSLVQLSPLLREIFRKIDHPGEAAGFLREIRAHFKLQQDSEVYPPSQEVRLNRTLTEAGFSVRAVRHYGTRLSVDIGWNFGDNIYGWRSIFARGISFQIREGQFTRPKWTSSWEECIEDHFHQLIKGISPSDPAKSFASQKDLEILKTHVEWNQLLLLSQTSIREKRIELIAGLPDLWESPKELARRLSDSGLYAESTGISQISRTVPNLIDAAMHSLKS